MLRFRAPGVIEALERVSAEIGQAETIRIDQGSQFISRDLDRWAYQRNVRPDLTRSGKPTDNSFIESLNGKFRMECLNTHSFMSLDDRARKCEAWRREYNEVRHTVRSAFSPKELMKRLATDGPR